MPYYRCVIPKDSLTFKQRQQIATAFTDVHCGISVAPRNFVNVNFLEVSDRESEIADSHGRGVLKYHTRFFIAGGNRAGRPPEMKEQILNGLIGRFSDIGGIPRDQLHCSVPSPPIVRLTQT
jgi:phenylpyruvate tautomerase PptA (4-oxalocrotonate tautomerase family)